MNKIVNILNDETFIGEDGCLYRKVTKEIKIPRKTFLKGVISGKYRGLQIDDNKYYNQHHFDFEIYEATVECKYPIGFQTNKAFEVSSNNIFPKEKLPATLLVELVMQNNSFGINILEPIIYDFNVIRKLHQIEGDEVFGSFTAKITGFVFDYAISNCEEIISVPEINEEVFPTPIPHTKKCECSNLSTGNFRREGNYIQKEYFCKHHDDKVWGKREYDVTPENIGCWTTISGLFVLIFGILFVIVSLPALIYIVPILLFLILLNFILPYLKWILKITGMLLFAIFIFSIVNAVFHESSHYVPTTPNVDTQKEEKAEIVPVGSNEGSESNGKQIIKRFRSWKDFNNKQYEGYYYVFQDDVSSSSRFKNTVTISKNNIHQYDKIIYSIKENDKSKLVGLYHLFDSIGKSNNLSRTKFAEMVVTFVQDIPYALILENDCDANLYNDKFIRQYLSKSNAICEGNQRFGINTPIEFLASLKGDCDSRTVLLYTILSQYNYDVAVLSSEIYGHSILGINLPYSGLTYRYKNQKYVMWETTAINFKPGHIPAEISNLNNWRISLKSK